MSNYYNDQWRLPNEENKSKVSNYSMDFDSASSDYIETSSNVGISGSQPRSMSVWLKGGSANNGKGWPMAVAFGQGITNKAMWIGGGSSNGLYWTFGWWGTAQDIYTSIRIDADENWHMLTSTYDGTTAKGYIDGVEVVSVARTINTTDSTLLIGKHLVDATYWDGQIDGVSIFDYTLSANQVTTLYGSSSTGIGNPMSLSPKPVAYYPLGDQDAFNGADYLVPNSSLKDYVFDFGTYTDDKYISINNTFDSIITGTNFTISAWVKLNSVASNEYKFIFTNESLQFVITNVIQVYRRGTSGGYLTNLTGSTSLNVNTWYNVVITKNGNDYTLFLNAQSDSTLNDSLAITNSYHTTSRIGMYYNTSTYGLDGLISNTQIFNTALPATGSNSVETLYNNGSPLTSMSGYSSLQGWWKLDASATYDSSTTTWTIPDSSSNSNDGTSSGMTQANLVQSDLQTVAPYSKYAMNFDAASSDYINFNSIDLGTTNTISFWHKRGNTATNQNIIGSLDGSQKYIVYFTSGYIYVRPDGSTQFITAYLGNTPYPFAPYKNTTDWANYIITRSGDNIKLYLNGVEFALSGSGSGMAATTVNAIGNKGVGVSATIDGSLSNVSVWNTALTSAQVTELYNEGLPSNLNSHSAYSNLVSWWQLGENSSFATNWICADEKGSNNGDGQNMGVDALVNGVGTTANGVSASMGVESLIGDAPYSTANALSSGMSVVSRVTDIPPTTTDADTTAFISRVTTAGGSLSTIEEQAVDTLVTDLKSANIWSKMSAIYPLVGASAAACAQNLKSSSYTGTFAGGWTYASTGITGNGNNNSMDTGLLPSTELSLNNTHLSFYSRTNTPTVTGDADMGVSAGNYALIEIWQGNFYSLINQNVSSSYAAVTTSLGHFVGSRISSSEVKGFQNGSPILTSSISSNNLATANISLGAMGTSYPSAREYAFASIGEGLTDAEASDFYTAVQAFQTTLSRNV